MSVRIPGLSHLSASASSATGTRRRRCVRLAWCERATTAEGNPMCTTAEPGEKMRVAAALTGMTGLAMAGTVPMATTAAAGDNGQKVRVCALLPPYYSVSIWGHNQNGSWKSTHWRAAYPNSCWALRITGGEGEIYIDFRSSQQATTYTIYTDFDHYLTHANLVGGLAHTRLHRLTGTFTTENCRSDCRSKLRCSRLCAALYLARPLTQPAVNDRLQVPLRRARHGAEPNGGP
jgi:hypothetical protein